MGVIGGMADFIYQTEQDAKKWELVDETQARQDTEMQRAAADAKEAGLSKTVAAGGSSASTVASPASSADADAGGSLMGTAQGIANLITQDANVSQTKAQTDLTNQQMATASADEKLKQSQLRAQNINNNYAMDYGVPVGQNASMKNEIGKLASKVSQGVKESSKEDKVVPGK